MKKVLIIFYFISLVLNAAAQSPSYQEKLYYTCKIWGFVRFNHSEVSVCKVNWDSILIAKLPAIKAASTKDEFNDVIVSMIDAAGPMEKAKYPFPYYVPYSMKFNRDFKWFRDEMIRKDVRAALDSIDVNYRPHDNCFIKRNDGTGYGWLVYPQDNPIYTKGLNTSYPDEFTILNIIFRYWNILAYFNPNSKILDTPWDSTLKNSIIGFTECKNPTDFMLNFRKMTSKLNDAHVEGLTKNIFESYRPKLYIQKLDSQYVVLKSGYKEISVGDVITSVNRKSVKEIEDSMSQFISYGNPHVFGRTMNTLLLSGPIATDINIGYKDSAGNEKNYSTYRYSTSGQWFTYTFNEELDAVNWKILDCNVAYVNMANLSTYDLNEMYGKIKNCKSIIFDVRNYPNGVIWDLAYLLFPEKMKVAFFRKPDMTYPGAFSDEIAEFGNDTNSTPYNGKIVIICNEETQSHAEYTCMFLQAMPGAVTVGSQTAGADGDVTRIAISQDMFTGYTSLAPYYPDGTQTQRIGVAIDSVVYQTPESIRRKRDLLLEKALEIAGCPVSVDSRKASESNVEVLPNPVKESAVIRISLEEDSFVSLSLYDIFGNKLKTIKEGFVSRGTQSFDFDGSELPAGIYYYQIKANGINHSQKLIIIK